MAGTGRAGQDGAMTLKLLIVDDSEPVRKSLLAVMAGIPGIDAIDQASTLAQALTSARRSLPTLVILDLHLPDGNGMDIIQTLKQIAPAMQLAVLTLHAHDSDRGKCLALGADWFFDKAAEFDQLMDVVRGQAALSQTAPSSKLQRSAS